MKSTVSEGQCELAHFPLARTATHAFFKCPGMEGWQSGRLRLIRNQMYRKVPGVRIPSPPPEKFSGHVGQGDTVTRGNEGATQSRPCPIQIKGMRTLGFGEPAWANRQSEGLGRKPWSEAESIPSPPPGN